MLGLRRQASLDCERYRAMAVSAPDREAIQNHQADGLHTAACEAGIAHTIARVGSMLTFFFNSHQVTNWDAASRCDTQRFARFFWGMLDRGVYLPCSQYEAMFVSAAHTEDDIQSTVAKAADVLGTLGSGDANE